MSLKLNHGGERAKSIAQGARRECCGGKLDPTHVEKVESSDAYKVEARLLLPMGKEGGKDWREKFELARRRGSE